MAWTGGERLMEVFSVAAREERPAYMLAPMVRYSKLPFRLLVAEYGCDVVFTPMIVAGPFAASQMCRDVELVTSPAERGGAPLVVQFAAKDADEFVAAAGLVGGTADAVDLNCGCPQPWARKGGLGAALLKKPEVVKDIIRRAGAETGVPVTVKVRLADSVRASVALCRALEAAGAFWVAVHGRTAENKRGLDVDLESIAAVVDALDVPVIANGDITTRDGAHATAAATGAAGVMVARGLLANPALFAGHATTPLAAVGKYLAYAAQYSESLLRAKYHVATMTAHSLARAEQRVLASASSLAGMADFFHTRYGLDPLPPLS